MVVMVMYQDFAYLSDLINKTGELVENCVFMYLVKAGVENIGKIYRSHQSKEPEDITDTDEDEPVG